MAFKPHAGLLRHPFTFRNVVKVQNDSAGHGETYSDFYSTRGYFRQRTGSMQLDEGVYAQVRTFEAYCYWRHALEANLSNDTRLVYDSKEYKINEFERVEEDRSFYRFELIVAS
jgi:hypothetical protein